MKFKEWLLRESGASRGVVFGWLTPRGNFYPVDKYNHHESIAKIPELQRLIPDFDKEIAGIEHIKKWSQDAMSRGEHPEWHAYEMASGRFQKSAVGSLYAAGCLRVGSVGKTMHFEGLPGGITGLYQKAKDLAEEYGMEADFDPR